MAVEAEEESAVVAARRRGREARACLLETHHGRLRLIQGLGGGGGVAPRSEEREARRSDVAKFIPAVRCWYRPSSSLVGYMREKKTQVDRPRERGPLAQLLTKHEVDDARSGVAHAEGLDRVGEEGPCW